MFGVEKFVEIQFYQIEIVGQVEKSIEYNVVIV